MSGLQRDHSVNENWTNGSGYNDGTAGAALNNIMRGVSSCASRVEGRPNSSACSGKANADGAEVA